ncbi:Peroxisomal biogenesis protein (peroxin) [Phaffia rhodozyma]|uniref:Peroxisomal biogenesis protein (Peroxin) n=1 Tax=Phaffia rhodozyma TaxID=264483 RepID=A0A0F7SEH0_PHARH|nr:Peroxisomal biogenesis protein (peroxin) [Phaffia rhodozyma]
MSSLALYPAQLILHPQVTQSLKVLSTTVGRDKLYRLIQYFARIVAWYLLRQGDKEGAIRWTGLKGGLTVGRKLMRVFKPVEHLQLAIKATQAPPANLSSSAGKAAEIERIAQVARQVAYAGYLTTDSVVYLQGIKFLNLNPDKFARTSKVSQRFWLAGILLSLISSAAGVVKVRKEAKRASLTVDNEKGDGARSKALVAQRSALFTQIVQDSLDAFIPASNLGLVELQDGTVGAIGVITSWMALTALWAKARV